MASLNLGPAKKFLYTCEYLRGIEVDIRRRRGGTTKGTVIGFGAHGSIWGKIRLWAKVKDNSTGRILQVDLMKLYRMYPRSKVNKSIEAAAQQNMIQEQPVLSESVQSK